MYGITLTFVAPDMSALNNIYVLPAICLFIFFFLNLTNEPLVKTQRLSQQIKGLGEFL